MQFQYILSLLIASLSIYDVIQPESVFADERVVDTIKYPSEWSSLDIVLDELSSIHVSFVLNRAVYYSSWNNHRRTWSKPLRLSNEAVDKVFDSRIAVRRDGSEVYIVWNQKDEIWGANLSRGKGSFIQKETRLTAASDGMAEMPAVSYAPDGMLYAVWIDHRNKGVFSDAAQFISQYSPDSAAFLFGNRAEFASADLWFAMSPDNGETFVKSRSVNDVPVCECCGPSVIARNSNQIVIAHRSTIRSVKEISLLISEDKGESFRAVQISKDEWKFVGCPHAGPLLRTSGDGNTLSMQWQADGINKAAVSRGVGVTFSLLPSFPGGIGSKWDHEVSNSTLTAISKKGEIFEASFSDGTDQWQKISQLSLEAESTVERIISTPKTRFILVRAKTAGVSQ